MKKYYIAFFAIFLSFVFIACGSSEESSGNENGANETDGESSEGIVMKLSHVGAPDSGRDLGAKRFKEVVEEETNGEVEVQIYPASQLGGQRDQVEGVQFGNIEMVVVPTAYLGGIQPLITLLDTPYFLPEDLEALLEFYKTDGFQELLQTTEEVGIKSLGIWHTGYKAFTANKPLLDPSDLDGLKVRVMPSPIIQEFASVLGADGITMDFSETYSALQTGAIDGQIDNPIDTIYDMKFHEVQTDITLTYHGTLDQIVMVNKDWYESLDADIQEAIMKGFEEGEKVVVDETYKAIDEYLEIILEAGINVHELTEEQLQAYKEAVKPVHEFAKSEFGDEGKELFEKLQAEIDNLQ